ncbi:MAG: hypothetical protein OXG15_08460, partial [Gammaproteobacteria bacterium]|nr:hypothetical protein [Gammaproteobacteria bacterium]
ISDKTICILDAWRKFYDVGVGENIEDAHGIDMLVVEPLWFRLRGGLDDLQSPNLEEAVKSYEDHPAKHKIVYCSEFAFIKLPKEFRDRIIEASSVVTTNCDYQRDCFRALGIETIRLCDPVDEEIYYSSKFSEKTLSIIAGGRISSVKNIGKIIRLFEALKDYPIETIYIGDASLWGEQDKRDLRLEREIGQVADVHHHNLSQADLASVLAPISYGVMDTIHDSCSAFNIILCMSGIRCFYGLHGAWQGRPGVGGLDTVQDFVEAINESTLTDEHIGESQKWAIDNYSKQAFLNDWTDLRKQIC